MRYAKTRVNETWCGQYEVRRHEMIVERIWGSRTSKVINK